MTSDDRSVSPNDEHEVGSGQNTDRLLGRLDDLDSALQKEIAKDTRWESGIAPERRLDDTAFIQMSGLTRPDTTTPAPIASSIDLNEPLSFFEPGVIDVDSATNRDALIDIEDTEQDDGPVLPSRPPSVASLKDIVAELSQEHEPTGGPPHFDKAKESEGKAERIFDGFVFSSSREDAARKISHPPQVPEAEALIMALEEQIRPKEHLAAPAPGREPSTDDAKRASLEPPRVTITTPIQLNEHAWDESPGESRQGIEINDIEPAGDEENDVSVYNAPEPHARRKHKDVRGRFRKRVIQIVVVALFLTLVTAAVYEGNRYIKPFITSPKALLVESRKLADAGNCTSASESYLKFASMHSSHPLRAEAQFQAAFVLQVDPDSSQSIGRDQLEESRALFERFLQDNPNNPKAARARNLIGILSFKLGDYKRTIDILRSPELQLQDPVSALSSLRILARAYAELGDIETAHSVYMQAATLTGNLTPDVDYDELGNLYKRLADAEKSVDKRVAFLSQARNQWGNAIQFSGISPTSESQMRFKRDQLQAELTTPQENESAVSAPQLQQSESAPTDSAAEAPVDASSEIPVEVPSASSEPSIVETSPSPDGFTGEKSAPDASATDMGESGASDSVTPANEG